MSKSRINISMDPAIRALADTVMEARRFSDFSGFLEQLIREEFDRRMGPTQISSSPARLSELIASYAQRRASRSVQRVGEVDGPAPSAAGASLPPTPPPTVRRKPR